MAKRNKKYNPNNKFNPAVQARKIEGIGKKTQEIHSVCGWITN